MERKQDRTAEWGNSSNSSRKKIVVQVENMSEVNKYVCMYWVCVFTRVPLVYAYERCVFVWYTSVKNYDTCQNEEGKTLRHTNILVRIPLQLKRIGIRTHIHAHSITVFPLLLLLCRFVRVP